MIWGWLVGSAVAGQLAVAGPEEIFSLDTRSMAMDLIGQIPNGYENGDISFDRASGAIVVEAFGRGLPNCVMELDLSTGIGTCLPVAFSGGVAHDANGVLGLFPRNVEYFPVRDSYVGLFNGIVQVDQAGNTTPLAPIPPGFGMIWPAIAWDEDLKLLWLVNGALDINVLAVEPTTFTPVVYGFVPNLFPYAATGAYDDTPNQTPILFVSGTCPGDLTVTIADASPGEAVRVVSSARPGRTTVPTGPCRGTRADLANPQPRATLVADAFGLATTHVQATLAMCGRTLVQALDEGSCLVTDVVAVPAVP